MLKSSVLSEFRGSELGDKRLDRRLEQIVGQVERAPSESFPVLMATTADREGLYRFFNNADLSFEDLLAGHIEATAARASAFEEVRVVHDTTAFSFSGEREGLGPIQHGGSGFYGHFALAVRADESRAALGLLPFIHRETELRRGMTRSQQVQRCQALPRAKKESSRWKRHAIARQARLPKGVGAIHLMDQEADDFTLLAELHGHGLRFVVRGSGGRCTAVAGEHIREALAREPGKIFRTVRVNRRAAKRAKVNHQAAREEREVEMQIRWAALTLPRPPSGQTELPELTVNVVHVFEPNPPEGEKAIEWYLFTGDRVDSLEDATVIVDHYRARWVIEEYFKALKSGCAFEKRQLCTYDALVRALAVFAPIAWRLLALRNAADAQPDAPAEQLLGPDGLKVLRVVLNEWRKDFGLSKNPSVERPGGPSGGGRSRRAHPQQRRAWLASARSWLPAIRRGGGDLACSEK